MRQAGAEVAGWIDGVSRGAAEAKSDAPNQHAPKIRAVARDQSSGGNGGSSERKADYNEGGRADGLGQEVRGNVTDRRSGAEDSQFRALIGGLFPVWQVG